MGVKKMDTVWDIYTISPCGLLRTNQDGGFELRKVGKGRRNSVEWWGSAGIGGRGL
nr:hypothetical protein [Tanacetum cinerariifolium]